MYDIVSNIIGHIWTTGSSEQQYIYYIVGALICIFSVKFIDMIDGIFSAFSRG